jgi:hypothetical protein
MASSRRWNKCDDESVAKMIFLEGVFLCFCSGFWRKRIIEGVFLVVNLWWNRGELWCVDGRILGLENLPLFDLFLWIPVLGIGADQPIQTLRDALENMFLF